MSSDDGSAVKEGLVGNCYSPNDEASTSYTMCVRVCVPVGDAGCAFHCHLSRGLPISKN